MGCSRSKGDNGLLFVKTTPTSEHLQYIINIFHARFLPKWRPPKIRRHKHCMYRHRVKLLDYVLCDLVEHKSIIIINFISRGYICTIYNMSGRVVSDI